MEECIKEPFSADYDHQLSNERDIIRIDVAFKQQ